jgi:nucleoside 2-deoxyribosyltransferase
MKTPNNPVLLANRKPRIYLAGPEVFLRNATQIGELKKELCKKYGFKGVFPIDTQLDARGLDQREIGLLISSTNEKLIRRCEILVANITPFRGPSADVGTVYEMGFARGIGLLVFAYTNIKAPFTDRTVSTLDSSKNRDKEGKLRDNNDMSIEEFGMVDNLMIQGCVNGSGGKLIIEEAPKDERFTYLIGFEQCLRYAREIWRK